MLYEAVRHIAGMIIHPLCNVGLKVLFDLRASSERKWAPTSGLFNWLSHDLALAFKFLKLTRNSTGEKFDRHVDQNWPSDSAIIVVWTWKSKTEICFANYSHRVSSNIPATIVAVQLVY